MPDSPGSVSTSAKIIAILRRVWMHPVGAWGSLFVLTGAVLWGCWKWLDLSRGDTASYAAMAQDWHEHWHFSNSVGLLFSPLYTVFYGAVLRACADAYTATMVHRVLIVASAAAAVLGVSRTVLPRAWAWAVAAWWVILPPNSFARYEVHVFGFALLALGCWLAGAGCGRMWRGAALAVLLVTSALVRNEFAPAVAFFALSCAAFECREAMRKRQTWREAFGHFAHLLVPSAFACAAVVALFFRDAENARWLRLSAAFERRHRLNMTQVYPFGYQQRRDDWSGDPWSEGGTLMTRDFGRPDATFGEALRANPRAAWEHVRWNVSLIPSGLQLALFGRYAGVITPDFSDGPHGSRGALYGSGALVAVWLGGAVCAWRRRGMLSRRAWPAGWTWIALLCCVPSCLVAIATQRPRPSYIFMLSLLLMVFTGLALRLLLREMRASSRLRNAVPILIGAAMLATSLWQAAHIEAAPHPVLEDYRRLAPFAELLRAPDTFFASNVPWFRELMQYLAADRKKDGSRPPLRAESLVETLAAPEATMLYLSGEILLRPEVLAWRESPAGKSWRVLAQSGADEAPWLIASRPPSATSGE